VHDVLFAKDSFASEQLHPPTVERLVKEHEAGMRDHTHRIFALMMLELWWREFAPSLEA